jgi:hypothetical protein
MQMVGYGVVHRGGCGTQILEGAPFLYCYQACTVQVVALRVGIHGKGSVQTRCMVTGTSNKQQNMTLSLPSAGHLLE